MPATLYERLGGHERIAAIVDEAVDRHAVNPTLAPRFRGKDLPGLKQLGVLLFCAGIGAAESCDVVDLRAARLGVKLREEEFRSAVADVVAALDGQGAAPAEVSEVVALLYAVEDELLGE